MSDTKRKPTLCLDFDGVIHDYTKGWRSGLIYGKVTPGFFEWIEEARRVFTLVIYSSRSKTFDGITHMAEWLRLQAEEHAQNWAVTDMPTQNMPVMRFLDAQRAELLLIRFESEKPAAFITIDDRAITFQGDWSQIKLKPDQLINFKPWNVK